MLCVPGNSQLVMQSQAVGNDDVGESSCLTEFITMDTENILIKFWGFCLGFLNYYLIGKCACCASLLK